MYYVEESQHTEAGVNRNRKMIRSRKSMERLRTLRMVNLEEQFQREFEKKFPSHEGNTPRFFD